MSNGAAASSSEAAVASARVRSHPPGPPPRGLIDNVRYFYGFAFDPLGFVRGRFDRFGDIYWVPGGRAGDTGLYVARHPDHHREVLVTKASSFTKQHSAFKRLSRFLGEGLLTTDGSTWQRQRRMVGPAFSPARLAGYADMMLHHRRAGQSIDLGAAMMELTLRVVSRALFGHDSTGDTADVAHAMSIFQGSLITDALPEWIPTPGRRAFRRANESLDRIMYGMIARRRSGPSGAEGVRVGTASTQNDLLGTLVDAVDVEGDGAKLTEREVRDQLVTLFLAGHETTSHALTWSLYLLAKHPEILRKLHEELDAVLEDGRGARFDDLPKLPYTQQVFEEAMRLYPPVYSIARRASEDVEIGGYPIPAGAEVILWSYFTHRDPRFFPDPNAFRPERFAPENEAKIPRFAYLPFGAGPRACIGKTFALMEGKVLLATLARTHRFELADARDVLPRPRITLVPKGGVKVVVRAR
jgi:cytochrome P450